MNMHIQQSGAMAASPPTIATTWLPPTIATTTTRRRRLPNELLSELINCMPMGTPGLSKRLLRQLHDVAFDALFEAAHRKYATVVMDMIVERISKCEAEIARLQKQVPIPQEVEHQKFLLGTLIEMREELRKEKPDDRHALQSPDPSKEIMALQQEEAAASEENKITYEWFDSTFPIHQPGFHCPFCYVKGSGMSELLQHISANHSNPISHFGSLPAGIYGQFRAFVGLQVLYTADSDVILSVRAVRSVALSRCINEMCLAQGIDPAKFALISEAVAVVPPSEVDIGSFGVFMYKHMLANNWNLEEFRQGHSMMVRNLLDTYQDEVIHHQMCYLVRVQLQMQQ